MRVAVARDPSQAIPLHGTFVGPSNAFIGMAVDVGVALIEEPFEMEAEA